MSEIDGVYRYAGTEVRWGREGVVIRRADAAAQHVRLGWSDIAGARRVGADGQQVQILLVEGSRRRHPGLSAIPVNSDADAHHLVTQFSWHAGAGYPVRTVPLPGDTPVD